MVIELRTRGVSMDSDRYAVRQADLLIPLWAAAQKINQVTPTVVMRQRNCLNKRF